MPNSSERLRLTALDVVPLHGHMNAHAMKAQAKRSVAGDLRQLVKDRAYCEGSFTLASGKHSDYYFDGKKVLLDHEGSKLFARWLLDQIETLRERPVAIGGLEIGAIPIASVCMALSDSPLNTFVVRKKPKEHGTGNQIEGQLKSGDSVVVVDDVITTGESTMKAVRALEYEGCKVLAIYCLVDRDEGHTAEFEERRSIFVPAFHIRDFRKK